MNIYDVGDKIRISGSFTASGVLSDPASVVFKLYNRKVLIETHTYGISADLIKDSVGNYHIDYVIPVLGNYSYDFIGSGTIDASETGFFIAKSV